MKCVAVYNMKGGVGKTTTAINLAYFAAAGGSRTLLWDLDPQAAASFAFRVRARVEKFDPESVADGASLASSIKATDFENLDILPAAFAYRKFDRFLDRLGKPESVVAELIESVAGDYDVLFLDCPAGFSLLAEGVFAAADVILVPAIPSVLSIRTMARLLKWAERTKAKTDFVAFLNMVDGRKALHRLASASASALPAIFLQPHIPYASAVEQMPSRRAPLPVFAAGHPAATAFAAIAAELDRRIEASTAVNRIEPDWSSRLAAVEALAKRLESMVDEPRGAASGGSLSVSHRFDTDRQDLERAGRLLELREVRGGYVVVLTSSITSIRREAPQGVQAQVDRSWALEILSGHMSPIVALERRLGRSGLVGEVLGLAGDRPLQRVASRSLDGEHHDSQRNATPDQSPALSIVRQAG